MPRHMCDTRNEDVPKVLYFMVAWEKLRVIGRRMEENNKRRDVEDAKDVSIECGSRKL